MHRGKFIAIEGPDASGKGTQQQLLIARLKQLSVPVATVDFPQYESSLFGKLVGRMLKGDFGPLENVNPYLASAIYAADRFTASKYIRQNLVEGKTVVANRYTLSNMAHQSARLPEGERENFIQFLYDMEYGEENYNIPKPDLYVYLKVPIEITQELLLKKSERLYLEGGKKDALEANIAHQIEAAKMYQKLAKEIPGIITVDCAPEGYLYDQEKIHELVWTKTSSLINGEGGGKRSINLTPSRDNMAGGIIS